MNSPVHSHVVVIGAGLSGLATARELASRNIDVTVLDAGNRVADTWRARHPQLRLNVHRHFAELPGMAMTRRDGAFVRRDTVVDYLERYAADLDVPIRFGVNVTGVERNGSGWRISTEKRGYTCEHVIVATGRDRIPHIPDWPGRASYRGEMVHAAEIGDISRFDGKRVLVVGAGNSGSDVLNHLTRHSPAQVLISVRHGPAIVPARIFGFPLHRLARLFAALPIALLDPAFRITQRMFLGNLARFGLGSHPSGGGTRLLQEGIAFAIDDGFVAALKQGRFQVVSEIVGFDGDRVLLANGGEYVPDTVICATGYQSGLDTLLGSLGVLDNNGKPIHPMGESDPAWPGLWFTGFRPGFTGYFDAARVSALRIADGIEAATTASYSGKSMNRIFSRWYLPRSHDRAA